MKNSKLILIVITTICLGFLLLSKKFEPSLEKSAALVVKKCANSQNRPLCYEKEIPKLARLFDMKELFDVTSEVQLADPDFLYCHTLGHKLAGIEVSKKSSNWKTVAAKCPVGMCSNGCLHGAFQEKFREEFVSSEKLLEIKGELSDICEKREGFDPSPLEEASCYHALGHLFMYITNADINKSVELCDELSNKGGERDFRGVCYDGSFMQIFQPLEAEDEALIYGKVPQKEEVFSYCSKFTGEANYSCWTESWPLTLGQNPNQKEVNEFCAKVDPSGKDGCFTDIFYILPIGFNFELDRMNDFCKIIASTSLARKCYSAFVSRILEIDYRNKEKAVNFCASIENETLKYQCFNDLKEYSRFVFGEGNKEIDTLCSYFPREFKNFCINN